MSDKVHYKAQIRKRFEEKKRRASTIHNVPPQIAHQKGGGHKINLDYIENESQVQNMLRTRYQENNFIDSVDIETAFFTDAVQLPPSNTNSNDDGSAGDSEKSNASIKTRTPEPDTPTHIASSYLQNEELPVIQPYEPTKFMYNDEELFYVSTELATVDYDLEKCRNIEDEGKFVPAKPIVKPSNRCLLINRLIEDGSFHCLDNDNNLLDMRYFHEPGAYHSHSSKRFNPIFVPATTILDKNDSEITVPDDKQINIFIEKLYFYSHYLFNEEQTVAKHIENLYADYKDRLQKKVIENLHNKLESLRAMHSENAPSTAEKYGQQIKLNRNQLHKEEKIERNLLKNLLEQWKRLKLLRERQKSSTTTTKMQIVQIDVDETEDADAWCRRFDTEFEEIVKEAFEDYKRDKATYKSRDDVKAKPQKPDIEEIKADLFALYKKTVRGPGEPKLFIEMIEDDEDVVVRALHSFEQYKYFLKIVIDNDAVTSTKHCSVDNNFHVDFSAKYSIRLMTRISKNIKIEIFEQSKYKMVHKIAEIFLPVPSHHEIFEKLPLTMYEFSSDKLKINGKLNLKVGWSYADDDSAENIALTKKSAIQLSKTLLDRWHEDGILNPLDPDTQDLMNVVNKVQLAEATTSSKATQKLFRFNEDRLAFCSAEEIENNERFNILIARYNNDLKYKSTKFVPQMEREIEVNDAMKIVDETIGMDPIDLQRHRGKRYLKSVYATLTNYCENLESESRNSNILIGDEMPSFGSMFLAFLNIFGPKRPLKPTRKSPTATAVQRSNEVHNFNIIVTVIRAFGIPIRNDDFFYPNRRNSVITVTKALKSSSSTVRPFISINLKDQTVRTSTAEGSSPTWNEQLTIPFNTKTDQTKKFLTFDLFDEYVEDLLEDDRARTTELYQRITSKWLGEFKIPISTIYTNHRIEGTLEIKTPPILLGYTKTPETGLPDMRELTHISLFISLEPIFEVPKLLTSGLECIELDQTKLHIHLWLEELALEFPERIRSLLVTMLDGKRVCITRLLGALNTPFPKDDSAECLVRRFVSLIPQYQSFDHCTDFNGIWLNNEQILNFVCATSKDLGVLLACYYLFLELDAWLIIGHGLLSGETCHVLLKTNDEYFIVDPESGRKYSSKDIYLPLTKVYYLVNPYNVWANIQKENRVFMTLFDVRKSRYWKPLFDKSHPAPIGLVHNLNFLHRKSNHTKDLTKIIEMKIMKKISAWRLHRKTVWNRFVSDSLKKVLANMETDVCFEYEMDRYMEHLNQLSNSYKAYGFPLHTSYTVLSQIVALVKNTGIHLNSDARAEFALAVYIKEYTNNILSVWIFLISLTPKN